MSFQHADVLKRCDAESWLMLRQELVRTVASRQMQLVGLPHNVNRVRRVAREVCELY